MLSLPEIRLRAEHAPGLARVIFQHGEPPTPPPGATYVGGADATDVQAVVERLERRVQPPTAEERAQNRARLLARIEAEQTEREKVAEDRARLLAGLEAEHERRLHEEIAEREREDARMWAEHGVSWDVFPGARFLHQVPDTLLAAWRRLLALPTKTLLARDSRGLPQESVLEDLTVVGRHLRDADWRLTDGWTLDGSHPNIFQVRSAVIWHRAAEMAPREPATPAARKKKQRDQDKEKVEAIYRDECRACYRTRATGVTRFDLHHPAGDGGGVHRDVDTDELRAYVIAYYEENGEPPPDVEMLCHACHKHQTAAQAAGCPWGDRVDDRTDGDPYSGDDYPEGLIHTRPLPAPKLTGR